MADEAGVDPSKQPKTKIKAIRFKPRCQSPLSLKLQEAWIEPTTIPPPTPTDEPTSPPDQENPHPAFPHCAEPAATSPTSVGPSKIDILPLYLPPTKEQLAQDAPDGFNTPHVDVGDPSPHVDIEATPRVERQSPQGEDKLLFKPVARRDSEHAAEGKKSRAKTARVSAGVSEVDMGEGYNVYVFRNWSIPLWVLEEKCSDVKALVRYRTVVLPLLLPGVTAAFWFFIYYLYGSAIGTYLVPADALAILPEIVTIAVGVYASYVTLNMSQKQLETSVIQCVLQVTILLAFYSVNILNAFTDNEPASEWYDILSSLHSVFFSAVLLPVLAQNLMPLDDKVSGKVRGRYVVGVSLLCIEIVSEMKLFSKIRRDHWAWWHQPILVVSMFPEFFVVYKRVFQPTYILNSTMSILYIMGEITSLSYASLEMAISPRFPVYGVYCMASGVTGTSFEAYIESQAWLQQKRKALNMRLIAVKSVVAQRISSATVYHRSTDASSKNLSVQKSAQSVQSMQSARSADDGAAPLIGG